MEDSVHMMQSLKMIKTMFANKWTLKMVKIKCKVLFKRREGSLPGIDPLSRARAVYNIFYLVFARWQHAVYSVLSGRDPTPSRQDRTRQIRISCLQEKSNSEKKL